MKLYLFANVEVRKKITLVFCLGDNISLMSANIVVRFLNIIFA
jgi:hypothetical protein